MEVLLSVEAGRHSDQELRSLLAWLRNNRALARDTRLRQPQPNEGDMGALSEVISILVPGGAGAALATSLGAWLSTRRVELSVTARRADGAEITVEQKGGKAGAVNLQKLREFAEGGGDAAP